MLRIVGIAPAHDCRRDDRIDLNLDIGAVRHGAQNIDSTAWANDGKLTSRSQNIGERGRSRHEIGFPFRVMPVRRVSVHDVSGSVGIDNDRLRPSLTIDFSTARGAQSMRELDPHLDRETFLSHTQRQSGVRKNSLR